MKYLSSKRGYTLLFAVLTASLVLSVAAFIVGVARKQYILSSAARDSLYALYAADTGMGCIMGNWNFSTTSPTMTCNGSNISFSFTPLQSSDTRPDGFNGGTIHSTDFPGNPVAVAQIPIVLNQIVVGQNVCVRFQIWSGQDPNNNMRMVVEARGYNMCDSSGIPLNNPRTVERAIKLVQ